MKLLLVALYLMAGTCWAEEITPYKFTDHLPLYEVPISARFTVKRLHTTEPEAIYYFSSPHLESFPIAILCGGSSNEDSIQSIIHVHRYFLKELLDLGVGVITVEQRGVDGHKIDTQEFMAHYTRSNRLNDHQAVIEHLHIHPPVGWNGKFIFLGVSEGGPLVNSLTTMYKDSTLATINWCGAGDYEWQEEAWAFIQKLLADSSCQCLHQIKLCECGICLQHIDSKENYAKHMHAIMHQPVSHQKFLGMTYQYHADAMLYPRPLYQEIKTPFLVVAGTEDTIIHSSDAFVKKARKAGANITYLRVKDMDHYVRKRPDVIHRSFEWLKSVLQVNKPKDLM